MSKDSIYTVDDNGNAAVRITTQTATTTDPSSIYGVDENGNAAMRVIGIGGGGSGTSDYNQLTNRPKINGVLLSGDKSTSDLGIHASKQITVNGTVTAGGYSVPNPTAEEMTAIYNAVVAGDSVQIVDKNNVYYQVVLADSMDGAINVEILYFSEMAIIYSLEHNVVTVETKKIGGDPLPDDFTNVKYTSKEAEIDWSNPAWGIEYPVYTAPVGSPMLTRSGAGNFVAGNEDNSGNSLVLMRNDSGDGTPLIYIMFTPDAIPLNGFPDVKAGVWYKVTDMGDEGATGFEVADKTEVIASWELVKKEVGPSGIEDQEAYDYFNAEILAEKAPVDITFGEKFDSKQDVVNVSNITDLSTFTINTNTIYNGAELTEFGINLPTTVDNKFIAEIHFTSGEEPTAFNWEDDILFDGVDCVENLFIPEANKRYSVMFFYNGESVLGIVYGI